MHYSDVELGDELPDENPDVSMKRITQFVELAGWNFPRFTDHEFAKSEGLPGAIVPGIMSQGLLAAMIHRWAPGCRIKKLDTVFRSPMVVDSKPVCSAAVTDCDDDTKTIELDITVVNEEGSTSVLGTALVELD